mgnify:CR=1 FL=1
MMFSPGDTRNGSSPHARGTHRRRVEQVLPQRLIPACAGNTPAAGGQTVRRPAHPRMRGEHARHCCVIGGARRLIPACAGNTPQRSSHPKSNPAHPRMRGEHLTASATFNTSDGSSPHARGTLSVVMDGSGRTRLIPACAGNTALEPIAGCRWSAHPRMRGEHTLVVPQSAVEDGSSPHARGTPEPGSSRFQRSRLIPACAGNTASALKPPEIRPGSSPHARGTRQCLQPLAQPQRLIPACAGNT